MIPVDQPNPLSPSIEDQTNQAVIDKYAALVNHLQQGFCIIEVLFGETAQTLDYRFLEVNAIFEQLTGLVEAVGKTMRELQPNHEQHWFDLYAQVIKTGQPIHVEQPAVHLAGGVWYDVFAFPLGPTQGHQVAIFFNDITQRKQTEQALRQREERIAFSLQLSDTLRPLADGVAIQQTVTQLSMAYFATDRCYYCEVDDGTAIIRQDASQPDMPSVVGEYPIEQFALFKVVVGAGHPFVVGDVDTTELVDEPLRQLCRQLQVISFLDVPVIKNGQPVGLFCLTQRTPRTWTEWEVALAQEVAERAWSAVERARTETALRQSEERYRRLSTQLEERVQERTVALSQANAALQRSNDSLQEFAYVASHDLQEPLRKIQSFTALLGEELGNHLSPTSQDYLQRITSASTRMRTLIKDLLTYSRLSTHPPTLGKIALSTVMAEVLTTLDWVIGQRQAQIRIAALPVIQGDPSQLGQLFQNLLSNAIKFTPEGQSPSIDITTRRCGRHELPATGSPTSQAEFFYQISVLDTGIGFDPKYVGRIFQVFQRLHGRHEFAGTGVGLAICQRVVANHGGLITAESQPGQGSSFHVYLPV